MHVLIVDDDRSIRSLMEAVFVDEGHTVSMAEHGLDAIGKIDRSPGPDVILLDLNMPVMDGRRFYAAFIAQGWTIPIVIVSAVGAQMAAQELGVAAGLDKPFDLDVLVSTVEHLGRKRVRD